MLKGEISLTKSGSTCQFFEELELRTSFHNFIPISCRCLAGNITLEKSLLALLVAMTTVMSGKVRRKENMHTLDFLAMNVTQILQGGFELCFTSYNLLAEHEWPIGENENHKITA